MDIVEFLTARLAMEEFEAQETIDHGQMEYGEAVQTAYRMAIKATENQWHREQASRHIDRWNPWRVLADVAAKRRIIELHGRVDYTGEPVAVTEDNACRTCDRDMDCGTWMAGPGELPCFTLRFLAAPYSSDPEFDPTWAVES